MTTPEPREDHELAPCPFCGSRAIIEQVGDRGRWQVSCGAGEECLASITWGSFARKAEAIAAWNRRPSPITESTPSIRDAVADGEGLSVLEPWQEFRRLCTPATSWHDEAGWRRRADLFALRTANTGRAEVLEEAARVAEDKTLVVSPYGDMTQRKIAAAIRALKSTPTAATAVEEEREACAALAEDHIPTRTGSVADASARATARAIAAAIRARTTKES